MIRDLIEDEEDLIEEDLIEEDEDDEDIDLDEECRDLGGVVDDEEF